MVAHQWCISLGSKPCAGELKLVFGDFRELKTNGNSTKSLNIAMEKDTFAEMGSKVFGVPVKGAEQPKPFNKGYAC